MFSKISFAERPLVLTLGLSIFTGGCVVTEQPATNKPANQSNTINSNSAMPSPSATSTEQSSNLQLTLPLLDAMLLNDTFASDAKKEIQLTDEELQKLRDASRNAVLSLDDSSADESRSTRSAVAEARKKIQDILGNSRGDRFLSLVEKHLQGESALPETKPNLVPDDTRIVVNIPAYRMDLFDDGQLVKSYKIGIGYPEFPLPTGLRKASTIIFNPTWTPPDEPWVKGKVQAGKKVEAGSDLNPLGVIKIPIGPPSLIHGGKSASRLGTFASHGCVGLTDAQVQDLAVELSKLSGQALTIQDVRSYAKAKTETKEIKLDVSIPIELRYETIVVENGTLKIYRDVYERGTNTEENLRQVLQNYGLSFEDMQPKMHESISEALEQMSLDPSGAEPDESKTSNVNRANTNAADARVTKSIRGKKEVGFKLPELAGKGYPAAVGMKF